MSILRTIHLLVLSICGFGVLFFGIGEWMVFKQRKENDRGVWCNDEMRQMIDERRMWLLVRELEKEGKLPITDIMICERAKERFPDSFPSRIETLRTVQALVPTFLEWGTAGLATHPRGDSYFDFWLWWPKFADAFGFGSIMGWIFGVIGVLGVVLAFIEVCIQLKWI